MTQIEKELLLKYMKAAIDLETAKATQEEIVKRYNKKMEEIKPKLITVDQPIAPSEPNFESENIKSIWGFANWQMVIVLLIYMVATIVGIFMLQYIAEAGFAIIVLFGVIPFLIYLSTKMQCKKRNKIRRETYETEYEHYESELQKVNTQNDQLKTTYNNDYAMWANKKESDSVSLNHQLKETESLLDKIYKRNFIYSKYYNLPALTSMYEYFVTGRCDDLAGPHGAYNMYEDEMRKDTVISQLSIVIQRLEQIKQNQYMLYQQVQIMNSNLNIISDSLSQIESYTGSIMEMSAINTYFASITARNAEISATMHLLNG